MVTIDIVGGNECVKYDTDLAVFVQKGIESKSVYYKTIYD